MKNLILTTAFMICPLLITSCGNSSTGISKETYPNNVETAKSEPRNNLKESANINSAQPTPIENSAASENSQKSNSTQPKIGTVKELVNGDLLCYVTLIDEKGTEHNVGASFEICEDSAKFLNKKVRASYTIESVNDCQSAAPCGKTKKESIITEMQVLDETSSNQSQTSKSQIIFTVRQV